MKSFTTLIRCVGRVRPIFRTLSVLLIVAGWSAFSSVSAEEYVSFNGKFRITIPDEWARADYQTVDYWLSQSGSEGADFNYEAVFTPRGEAGFAQNDYLILTVDTIGELEDKEIDSILGGMYDVFGDDLKYSQAGDLITSFESHDPIYNSETKTASVVSDLIQPDNSTRKSLLVMKFYDRGIANFYFYSPDSTWKANQTKFAAIVESFASGEMESSLPAQEVKVADIKEELDQDGGIPIAVWAGIVVVIIAITASRLKKKKQ